MENDNKTKEYLEKLQNIKLSDSARERIEKGLLEYARFHAVREGEEGRSIGEVSQNNGMGISSIRSLFVLHTRFMTTALIILALALGGGTSFAAEGAVPGDFLYPVKVQVNENVKGALAVTNSAQADLDARLVSERLEEAEALAAEGKLSAEATADIRARVEAHYNDATSRAEEAEAEGDYETSAATRAALEGTLRAHADILTNIDASVSVSGLNSLIVDIRSYATATAEEQVQATATVNASASGKASAEATVALADRKVEEVNAELVRAKSKLNASVYARVSARYAEAVQAKSEAHAALQAELYSKAYASAHTAIRVASEVEAMIGSVLRINVSNGTNSVIDLGSDSDVSGNANVDTSSEVDDSDESNGTVEEDAQILIDGSIDTPVIDVDTNVNGSLRSNLGL